MLKVSIITVCYNSSKTIEKTIKSVLKQKYNNIEYLIIDGGSNDSTMDVINKYRENIDKVLSENDSGLYDAINKGIKLSTGEIIGLLHSDDIYASDDVISSYVSEFYDTKIEFIFSNMIIINQFDKVIRYYKSSFFSPWLLRTGWMPPHPTTFMRRTIFDEFGFYSEDYEIIGDYEFFIRLFFRRKIQWKYINQISIVMSSGGLSNKNIESKKQIAKGIHHVLTKNGIITFKYFQIIRYLFRLLEICFWPIYYKKRIEKIVETL